MRVRIHQAIALAAICLLVTPLARAHVGEHATGGPVESLVHLLTSADHWLAIPLLLVGILILFHLLKVRSRS
jgi:hypothetical protein